MNLIRKMGISTTAVVVIALGTPAIASASASPAAASPGTCDRYWYCVYTGTGYTIEKIEEDGSVADLNSLDFANSDASIQQDFTAKYVRLYYDTEYFGAWVCIDPNTHIPDLGNYTFNNGAGKAGYGQTVKYNVASIGVNSTPCTNPI